MKDKEFEDKVKNTAKNILKSYTTINPKKIANNLYDSASNTVKVPIETARSNIELFNRFKGNNDKKLSYEELYSLKNADENLRQKNYTNFSIASLVMFVFMLGVAIMGGYKIYTGIDTAAKVLSFMSFGSGVFLSFAVYFRCVVRAYCLKYATVDNKLNALKGIDNILPNPFYDVRATTNSEDKPIIAYLETKEEQERNK
ncbi:hypothetical protein TX187_24210 [Escherichia coli]|uniref:Uncharacterized protein n=3 Tax=Enterobacteriaceae TaxID=543 RepID=A0A609WAQ2_SALET|nr:MULTISPECIES: hypothetical protein [Enterobacteriaceae]EBM9693679.1 hypothetical protein [Salmonella enterica subsp. enterica serovar Infantis]EBN4961031.1 hypothetical protein [Salmonella enterica]ECV4808283.1 hypothetical protein [Salmonella enterica subsp. enterica serovar Braenderup]EKT9482515.1 hypothetical protein [Klebsiella pneumoniae]ELT0850903.1 hypothetical protein [Raoultella ornithinolytica]